MLVGRIVGTVIATQKNESLVGLKLLIAQPTDMKGNDIDTPLIVVDTVGAGVGENVIYITGSVAPCALKKHDIPIDACIIGIIDRIDLEK